MVSGTSRGKFIISILTPKPSLGFREELRQCQNLPRSTHVAVENEGDDNLRGDGLSVNRGCIKFPGLNGDDCLLSEGRNVVNYTNLFGLARPAYGYVKHHCSLGHAGSRIVCERCLSNLRRRELGRVGNS